nr:hypothetical protein [Candidatus Sigynarchaeota archaeon]
MTPSNVIGRPLAGYTPIPRCTGKYDDIHARGVLIEDTTLHNVKKYTLFISMDFLKLPLLVTDYIKEKIQDATNRRINPDQVLIHATHTHKSLDMGGEFVWPGGWGSILYSIMFGAFRADDMYKVWLAKRVAGMVVDMLGRLQPAKIAWTKQPIQDDFVVNRRYPARRTKPMMGIIAFKHARTNETMGILTNYSMHPTTLSFGVSKLSADYPGRLVHRVSDLTGGKVAAIHFTAPAGDINPITTCGTDFDSLEHDKNPIYKQKGDYQHTKRIGHALGEKALEIAKGIPDGEYRDTVEVKGYNRTFWVPMNDFKTYWSSAWVKNRVVYGVKRHVLLKVAMLLADRLEPNFPGFAIKHRGKDVNIYSCVQYIKIRASNHGKEPKDLAIAGIPGELFDEYARGMLKKTPEGFDNTFIFQNANDWVGYLFPLKEYVAGGYEPFASFSPFGGAVVNNNYLQLVADVDDDLTGGYS